jgi:hypothetical protein
MNKVVEGRFAKPPPKPPCEHYSVKYNGQIRCKHCKAIWNIGANGPIWVEADA